MLEGEKPPSMDFLLERETTFVNLSEFQIRGGIEDNLKIFFLISRQNICCDPSLETP